MKDFTMKTVITKHSMSDGKPLFVKIWGEPADCKACILLVHGLGEHIERYEHVASMAVERGLCMIGYDQRGHGQTEGKRGVIGKPTQLMDDLQEILGYAQSLCGDKSIFLYGHSLGALEVLYFGLTAKPNIAGVIATSPPLATETTSKSQKVLVGILKGILPNITVPNALNTSQLSRDEQIVKAYVNDPLVHDQASVALGAFLIDGAEYVLAHAGEWRLPLFLAHGSADGICPIAGSKNFMKATKPDAPISFKIWDGAYHETHNEPDKDIAITAFLDWIDEQHEQR
jgi:alpha-beta hydrolase superfamily lysophospholipase